MPRLFVGLEIPDDVAAFLSGRRGGLPGARWIDAENYHITLRFIGDIDLRTAREVDEMLLDLPVPRLEIVLDHLGTFGGDRPHTVYAGVQPNKALNALQADLERRTRRLGLPAESRKFTPHVTLARLRGASVLDVADYLAAQDGFRPLRFETGQITLFSSRESVGGGPYLVEAAYPMAV